MQIEKINNTAKINAKKVQKVYDELMKVIQKNKLTVNELIILLSNLSYSVGGSIGGYKNKGPSASELEKMYLEKPTLDVALMLNGLLMSEWINSVDKDPEVVLQELKDKQNET